MVKARLKRNIYLYGHTEALEGTYVEVVQIDDMCAVVTGTVWNNMLKDDLEFEEVVGIDDIDILEEDPDVPS